MSERGFSLDQFRPSAVLYAVLSGVTTRAFFRLPAQGGAPLIVSGGSGEFVTDVEPRVPASSWAGGKSVAWGIDDPMRGNRVVTNRRLRRLPAKRVAGRPPERRWRLDVAKDAALAIYAFSLGGSGARPRRPRVAWRAPPGRGGRRKPPKLPIDMVVVAFVSPTVRPANTRTAPMRRLVTPSRSIPKMSGFESRLLPQLGPGASCGPWVMRTPGETFAPRSPYGPCSIDAPPSDRWARP
jgi:hypothetical protein